MGIQILMPFYKSKMFNGSKQVFYILKGVEVPNVKHLFFFFYLFIQIF